MPQCMGIWTQCHKERALKTFMESEGVWYFITHGIVFVYWIERIWSICTASEETRKSKGETLHWRISLELYFSAVFYKLKIKKIVTTVEFYLALVPSFTASFFLRKLNCTCIDYFMVYIKSLCYQVQKVAELKTVKQSW